MSAPTTPSEDRAERIEPCPFCGGEARLLRGNADRSVWRYDAFSRVFCVSCQTRQLYYRTDVEAVSAWNFRYAAPVVAVPEELRRLAEASARDDLLNPALEDNKWKFASACATWVRARIAREDAAPPSAAGQGGEVERLDRAALLPTPGAP